MIEKRVSISRRRFLKGAAAAALAGLLSSCGLSATKSPAPTPPGRLTPLARSSLTPTGTASPTPTATPTAVGTPWSASPTGESFSSPLATPTVPPGTERPPSPTPTPLPTPFPAGPPAKLGLFVAWYHPQIMDLIATRNVAVLKTLEFDPAFLADVKARSPETIIVGRVLSAQIDLNQTNMQAEARRAVEAVLPLALDERRKGLVDAWEGFNEPVAGDEGQMRRLADLEVERVRLLADNGLRAVVGNFGAGHPPLEWWPAFRPALEAAQAHDGYLGLHEYSAPTIWYNTNRADLDFGVDAADEGWLTLRYRKAYRQYLIPWGLQLPLLITECGVDGMVQDRPGPPGKGWKDFGDYWAELGMGPDTPGNYIEQLAWYDHELQLDDYVLGATIFAMTAFKKWDSYQILGDASVILQQYLSVHPPRA
jgi:TAT (twin-arginine translocation) pathway signal sequence